MVVSELPEDWSFQKLGDFGEIISGGTPSSLKKEYWNGNILWAVPSDITKLNTNYIGDTKRKITKLGLKKSSAELLPIGSILITSRATIGECAITIKPISTNQGFQNIISNNKYDILFVFYSIVHSKSKLVNLSSGSTFLEIRKGEMKKIIIPTPNSILEQQKIGQILSKNDELIEKLETIITKKKNIKQGTIQELLSGKRRLQGFNEKWINQKLIDVTKDIRDGTHQTPIYVKNGIPFYSVESITDDNFTDTKYISKKEHKMLTKSFKIEKGDILMTRIGSIGDCKLIDWDVDASFYVSLALLKLNEKISPEFLYQYSKSNLFKKELEIRSLQWAVPKKINLNNISEIPIRIPSDKKEQMAIAQIISDMESEIKELEEKRDKYIMIKNGMMQKLLTGEIRLS